MDETIATLCRQYTHLEEAEIAFIEHLAGELQYWADRENVDAFINCASRNGDSIVVAQAGPSGVASAYRHSVVGMRSKPINEPAVARTFHLGCTTRRMLAMSQEKVPVIQVAAPICMKGKVIGVLTYERPADQANIPDPLDENFQDLQQKTDCKGRDTGIDSNWFWLSEYIDEALMVVDGQGFVAYRNPFAKNLYAKLGYVEDILGQLYKNISLVDQPDREYPPPVEVEVGKYILCVRQVRIQEPDVAFVVIIKDITNLKATERELTLKSVVVQEMHHRVKNNLQTIASLLRLQRSRTANEEAKHVLTEASNRISAIAATHQLLAQNGVEQVMLKEVIESIKNNALRSCNPVQMDVRIRIRGDDFKVDSDIATSVGLVINELLQNSLQHGFVDRTEGRINIRIQASALYGTITVEDDGIGFDSTAQHLGLSIVRSLVREKLKGSLEIVSGERGTSVTFDFLI